MMALTFANIRNEAMQVYHQLQAAGGDPRLDIDLGIVVDTCAEYARTKKLQTTGFLLFADEEVLSVFEDRQMFEDLWAEAGGRIGIRPIIHDMRTHGVAIQLASAIFVKCFDAEKFKVGKNPNPRLRRRILGNQIVDAYHNWKENSQLGHWSLRLCVLNDFDMAIFHGATSTEQPVALGPLRADLSENEDEPHDLIVQESPEMQMMEMNVDEFWWKWIGVILLISVVFGTTGYFSTFYYF